MGGPVQAEQGVLGGIVGATDANFKIAEPYLKFFVKIIFTLVQLEWVQNQNY
jgi:3-hydroxyisobutyrate dehydrogenase-like beta-hydroxyacid dehydrogenase